MLPVIFNIHLCQYFFQQRCTHWGSDLYVSSSWRLFVQTSKKPRPASKPAWRKKPNLPAGAQILEIEAHFSLYLLQGFYPTTRQSWLWNFTGSFLSATTEIGYCVGRSPGRHIWTSGASFFWNRIELYVQVRFLASRSIFAAKWNSHVTCSGSSKVMKTAKCIIFSEQLNSLSTKTTLLT